MGSPTTPREAYCCRRSSCSGRVLINAAANVSHPTPKILSISRPGINRSAKRSLRGIDSLSPLIDKRKARRGDGTGEVCVAFPAIRGRDKSEAEGLIRRSVKREVTVGVALRSVPSSFRKYGNFSPPLRPPLCSFHFNDSPTVTEDRVWLK